ncbi:uncharacterized protein LOC130975255 [Arachis stenosperma]|uniref:uncharacterized protein LOC130975255 n=1 Tax=Arachis stenosperma TaxID=217475 RepID=UPI0025AC1B8B|nr:uncharacterized protein LOC130975255 [Arachis stenosperma]
MLAKTQTGEELVDDLKLILGTLRKHRMRLNLTKCAFRMETGKFLGFMITQRGVEANLEKCKAILEMNSPANLKDVQRLMVYASNGNPKGHPLLQTHEKWYRLQMETRMRRRLPTLQKSTSGASHTLKTQNKRDIIPIL